jgi:hypothetical protein
MIAWDREYDHNDPLFTDQNQSNDIMETVDHWIHSYRDENRSSAAVAMVIEMAPTNLSNIFRPSSKSFSYFSTS